MKRGIIISASLLLALAVSSGPATAVMPYEITDLGTPGDPWEIWSQPRAYGINASGQVVGSVYNDRGNEHAFLWDNGVMHDLGTLGGAWSVAYGINASGQVVGTTFTDRSKERAFLWEDGVGMQNLGAFTTWGWSGASGINASGQIVGWADTSSGDHAVMWDNGVIQDLGTLGGYQREAYGINDSAQVVGMACTEDQKEHAFLWENGVMHDLGTLGGLYSLAFGINASGQVVGAARTADRVYHAFLWKSGVGMQDLGTLGPTSSEAYGVNGSGQVVGFSKIASGDDHAFLWENGVMYDLNSLVPDDSVWVLEHARGINDLGQIVGYGSYYGGTRAFLLTPIPEPSALGLLAFALLAAIRCLRPH